MWPVKDSMHRMASRLGVSPDREEDRPDQDQAVEVSELDPRSGPPLTPEERAVLEDRLAVASLDVFGDIHGPIGHVYEDA